MDTTNKKEEQIFIGNDDIVVELIGEAKVEFIADREARAQESLLLEAEATAKKQARIDAITKLGQASGLTTEEIESILNI
jgi:hypothetical protein